MTKCIHIDGRPFEYEEEVLTYDDLKPITEEEAVELIRTVKKLFHEVGLEFYLAWGTLLGAVRDKGLIKGDEDVDVYVDDEQKLFDNLPFFYDNGLKLIRMWKKHIYSFRVNNNAFIDIYIKSPCGISLWKPWCCSFKGYVTPKKYLDKVEDIDFLGEECKCPANPERILEFWYGKTWRTPIRGHQAFSFNEIPIAHYWHVFKKEAKRVIQQLIGWKHLRRYFRKD